MTKIFNISSGLFPVPLDKLDFVGVILNFIKFYVIDNLYAKLRGENK